MGVEDIALTLIAGLGTKGTAHLLAVFGSAEAIFGASVEELTVRAELRGEIARRIVEKTTHRAAEKEMRYLERHGLVGIASTDAGYPPLLRECPDYPHVLYVRGNPAALGGRMLSMVGTRKFTPYGLRMCDELVQGLAERMPGLCIVSGLAFGVDVGCHRAALRYGLPTVAVIASVLPGVTPVQHESVARQIVEQGGAVVSELHSQTRQNGMFYLSRNRIIAGLGEGTVVVESPSDGGAIATARMADGYDRTVMAVPGRAGDRASEGTNALIRSRRATLVESAGDIVAEMMWDVRSTDYVAPAIPVPFRPDERQRLVIDCFVDADELDVDRLVAGSGFAVAELSVILLSLEFEGVLRALPGNRYRLLRR